MLVNYNGWHLPSSQLARLPASPPEYLARLIIKRRVHFGSGFRALAVAAVPRPGRSPRRASEGEVVSERGIGFLTDALSIDEFVILKLTFSSYREYQRFLSFLRTRSYCRRHHDLEPASGFGIHPSVSIVRSNMEVSPWP